MSQTPTSRQLSYLRTLAQRTGQTFTPPRTRQQASAEIARLKSTPADSRTERRIERKLIADQIQAGPQDAARIRDDEISGRGSSATWAHNRNRPPATQAATASRPAAQAGERVELARYTLPDGERRVIYGQRVDSVVRVVDRPAADGRAYLIERGLSSKAELDALIADYLAQAQRLEAVPAAESPIDRYVQAIEA